ncbi:ASCH domain-containing protein [Cohnella cellulosilytica]|uniref:ASCH domain-containing protein n=1 Tax=Cohnella cellulosilytica TaxID=986710 RepID=UPI00361A23D5
MKAITVWQPWATLIALRLKRFETRSWSTKYRGPIAIHAAKHIDREACEREPIKSALAEHGYTASNLPTGVVVATCILTDCLGVHRTDGERDKHPVWLRRKAMHNEAFRNLFWAGGKSPEYYFGDYSDGRFVWELTEVKQLPQPIPAKGKQRLWNWEPGEGGRL